MVLSLACLGATGYFVYRMIKQPPGVEEVFKQAETTYSQGEDAFKAGNAAVAAERFGEARKQVEQVLGSVEKSMADAESSGKKLPKQDEMQNLRTKAHYLRAHIIRDYYFAKAAADGKPIAESLDSSTGEKYRNFLAIPDEKDRVEAVGSLRTAAVELHKDGVALRECLRVELQVTPINWERLSNLCSAILELDPKDSRAHYWLARYEFLQPQLDDKGYTDTDPAKRSSERVERALRAVRKAKELGTQPPWRLLEIEARALDWLAEHTPKKKGAPNKSEDELRSLLFHPTDGALAKARSGQTLELPTLYDLQGVLVAHTIGARLAARDAAKPGSDTKALASMARGLLETAPKLRASVAGKANSAEINLAIVQVANAAQPVMSAGAPADWEALFDKCLNEVGDAKAPAAQSPALTTQLTDLIRKEIRRAAERGDKDREEKLKKRQSELVNTALKDADASKATGPEREALHARALETKLIDGASNDELAVHIEALAAVPAATRPAIAAFAEAVVALRKGQFNRARERLETALRRRDSADFHFAANVLLYQIYSAMGQPGPALSALREREPFIAQPEKLSALDRAYLPEAASGTDDHAAFIAIANLDVARQRMARHSRDNPETPAPAELWTAADKMGDATLKKLRTPSAIDLHLRLHLFHFRMQLNRRDAAEELIAGLRRDYSNSLCSLAAQAEWLARPRTLTSADPKPSPDGIKEADSLIQDFARSRPRDAAAKLIWVEWLTKTGRLEDAVAFLKDLPNLDNAVSGPLLRGIAHLRGYPLAAPEAREVLEDRPDKTEVFAELLEAARPESESAPADPFRRVETGGRQALAKAAGQLADGHFEHAAHAFAEVILITDLSAAARDGLWRTLRSCTAVDPARARAICGALSADFPEEPTVYYSAAIAALAQGEIGQPRDGWDRSQITMAGALNRWEPTAKRIGGDPATLAITRARFWTAVGQTLQAREEAARALAYDATDVPTMVFYARQSLATGTEDGLKAARARWNTAVAIDPDDLAVRCLEAEIKGRTDPVGATALVREIVKDHPKSSRAWALLVRLCDPKLEAAEALNRAKEWRKTNPSDLAAAQELIRQLLLSNRLGDAKAAADEFLADCKAGTTGKLNDLKAGLTGDGLTVWEKNSALCAANVLRYARLGVAAVFRQGGQSEEADARLNEALQEDAGAEPVLLQQATAAVSAGKSKDAWQAYHRILVKNPRQAVAAAGAVKLLTGPLDDASTAFRVVKAFGTSGDDGIDPDIFPHDLVLAIGAAHEKFGSDRPAIRRILVGGLKRFPNDARLQLYTGQLHYALGDGRLANDCLQRALKLAKVESPDMSAEQRKQLITDVEEALRRLREEPKTGNSDT
jgi:tetratricopeptide (TPR) repeat protein